MDVKIELLRREIGRLGKALDILAHAMRIQRLALEQITGERDQLRSQLDNANAKITCLIAALKQARDGAEGAAVLPFTRNWTKHSLH